MNQDFKDLFVLFNQAGVKYLIVGGYAVIKHAEPRYTKDIDIWVSPDLENAKLVYECLVKFGAPISTLSVKDFTDTDAFFTMGMPPNRVDILFDLKGVKFEEAWEKRVKATIDELNVWFIDKENLIKNKLAAGRHQDLADVEKLKKAD